MVVIIASLSFSKSYSQEFEYQIDRMGNAFYCDSVKIINREPAVVYNKFAEWFKLQITTSSDTLIFSQDNNAHITAKKLIGLQAETDLEQKENLFTISININFAQN